MQEKNRDQILAAAKVPLNHPLFYPRIFALITKWHQKNNKNLSSSASQILEEEYEEFSRRLDRSQIQESPSVRNVLQTRQLAQFLINEKGELKLDILPSLIAYFKKNLYSIGPDRQYDAKRQEHILKVLELLNTQKKYADLIRKFTKPFANKWAEELIRQTLQLPSTAVIDDTHTKQAALAAWLCYLRQNVGSCFATAPAEIIHDEQPELFLQDLLDLIATGQLKRTFGGIENSVPLSKSWGNGDLKKPLLLQKVSRGIVPEIWYSPGLLAAFEAIGFLKLEDSIKQKIQIIKEWILHLIKRQNFQLFHVLTVENVLRSILLQQLDLTEKQIKEYGNFPKETSPALSLITYTSKTPLAKNNVKERCAKFFNFFETAKNIFKSLADNALLKAWEFTLASFSDIKYEFGRWNFYASLGLGTNEAGGIGQCIYQTLQAKLTEANQKVQDIQYEYEMIYTQVKTVETRMRHASSEQESQWFKIEHQSRSNEFYFLQEQRDAAQAQAAALVNLYDTLYKIYIDLFKDYFQEVYDAEMQEITTGPFDDSPAGFRLLYKHGRSSTAQWTPIENSQAFIESLASFFVATEPQIAHALEEKKIERDLSDVVTNIITHIKTKEFLESAFHRMAAAHHAPVVQNPLEHLDKIEKKPWVYTSGGTMNTLVSCYYRLEDKPKEAEKWVESETELLVYLADTLKQIPLEFINPYLKKERESLLMQSPTHAFLLKPLTFPFRETWSNEEFTYTFVRDHFILPAEIFVKKILLDDGMLKMVIQQLAEKIPENFVPRFKQIFNSIKGPLSPIFLRDQLIEALATDKGLRHPSLHTLLTNEEMDHFFYVNFPFFPSHELKEKVGKILTVLDVNRQELDQILLLLDQIPLSWMDAPYISAKQLQDICKALFCLYFGQTRFADDYPLKISLASQKLGFAMPAPLIFADTNWVKDMLGFVVNPGTAKLELWRLDYTGSVGFPMTSWKQWVNGSRPDLKWGIYIKPFQYGQI